MEDSYTSHYYTQEYTDACIINVLCIQYTIRVVKNGSLSLVVDVLYGITIVMCLATLREAITEMIREGMVGVVSVTPPLPVTFIPTVE